MRYGSIDFVMGMDVDEFFDLVDLAIEKEEEQKLHKQWCSMLPFMSLKMLEYISFPEYIDKCSGKNIDIRPTHEIIAEIEATHQEAKKKRGEH